LRVKGRGWLLGLETGLDVRIFDLGGVG